MAVTLYDATGRPVDTRLLTQDEGASVLARQRGSVRGMQALHPADGITPGRLGALLRHAERADAFAYLELAEQMEERDLHYVSVLGTRKRAVTQLPLQVVAAGDDAESVADADVVRAALERDDLEDDLFDLLDAIGKGYSAVEILWETSERAWMPRRFMWRDPRWFKFAPDGEELLLRTEDGAGEPLAPYKWIVHRAKAKSGLAIRGGLARIVAWVYMFKHYSVTDWVSFAETYGQPFRVGKYDNGSSAEDRRTLLEAVLAMGADAAAVIPRSMEVELTAANMSSTDMYERMCDWLDRQVSKGVLGQTLTTEVQGGSYAAASVHNDVRGDIQRADARQLVATLNAQFVRPLVDLNRGPRKKYPKLVLQLPDGTDLSKFSAALGGMVDRGLSVEQRVVREKFGLPEPKDDAPLLTARTGPAGAAVAPPVDATAAQTLRALRELVAAQAAIGGVTGDARAQLVQDAIDDSGWRPLVAPAVSDARGLLDGVAIDDGSLASARAKLTAAIADALVNDPSGTEQLVEQLARAMVMARAAGAAGLPFNRPASAWPGAAGA